MRGEFTTPRMTFRHHMNVQVKGTVVGWVVRRREAARSAVSGKSLARPWMFVHGMGHRRHRPEGPDTSDDCASGALLSSDQMDGA